MTNDLQPGRIIRKIQAGKIIHTELMICIDKARHTI